MENTKEIILKEYYNFRVDNFNYDPITLQKPRSIFSKTLTFRHQKTKLDNINFPKNNSYFLFYQILNIFNNSDEDMKMKNEDIIHKILSFIYEYIESKEDFNPINSFNYYFDDILFPFINSNKIYNKFENKNEFYIFLLFNIVLVLSKGINEEFFNNLYFSILEVIILYEYFFIKNFSKDNNEINQIIINIIISIINDYINISNDNIIINFLRGFLFDEGKINGTNFLIPEKNIENYYSEFEDFFKFIKEKIETETKNSLKLNKNLFDNLIQIKRNKFTNDGKNENLKENNNTMKELISENIKQIKKLETIIFELKENIKEKENEILNLQNQLNDGKIEKEKELKQFLLEKFEKENEIKELNNQINKQKSLIITKNNIIEEQKILLNEQKLQISKQEKILSEQELQIKEQIKKINDSEHNDIESQNTTLSRIDI